MAEKRFSVRMVAEGGQQVRQEFDALTGRARTAYQEIVQGAKSAERSAAVFEAAIHEQGQAFDGLRASLDPAFAAQRRYEAAVETAQRALRSGIATQEQYNAVVAQARLRLRDMDGAVVNTTRAAGQNSFAMRNMAMQMSQVASQGAVTGNYLSALAIQLPDLALGFGTVGIVVGALAGSLAMALLPSLTGARDGVGEAAEGLETLSGSIDRYRSHAETAAMSTSELTGQFGRFAASVRETALFIAESEVGRIRDEVQGIVTVVDAAAGEIRGLLGQAAEIERSIAIGEPTAAQVQAFREAMEGLWQDAEAAADALGLTTSEVLELNRAFDGFRASESMEEFRDSSGAVVDLVRDLYGEGQNLPPVLRDAVAQMSEIHRNAILAVRAAAGLSTEATKVKTPLEAGARAAGGLTGSLGAATGLARQLVAALGQVPAAVGAIADRVDGAIGALEAQNTALRRQIDRGISAASAGILTARDEALATAATADNPYSIDQLAAMGSAFDAQAARAEELARANAQLTETLSEMRTAATGSGSGTGSARGGAAGGISSVGAAAQETWWQLDETTRRVIALREAAEEMNRSAGTSLLDGLLSSGGVGSASGPLSGVLGQAQSAFMGSPVMQGLVGGIGAALGPLMPAIGMATTALQLLRGFSSSRVTDRGQVGQLGGGTWVKDYVERERSSWWGLRKSTSTSYDDNADATRALREAGATVRQTFLEMSGVLGTTARDIRGVSVAFDGDLRDATVRYGEALAAQVAGIERFRRAGETALGTVGRLSESLSDFNAIAAQFGFDRLSGAAGAARASNVLQLAGGANTFASNLIAILGSGNDTQRMRFLRDQLQGQLRSLGFGGPASNVDSMGELHRATTRALDAGNFGTAARLSQLAPIVGQITDLQRSLSGTAGATKEAADAERRLARAREDSAFDQQRVQIARLRGDEHKARQIELALMEPVLRAGQRRIWQLEDEAARLDELARQTEARDRQRVQIARLRGDEEKAREIELALMEPYLRAGQRRIWQLEDQARATEAAAAAEDDLRRAREGLGREVAGYGGFRALREERVALQLAQKAPEGTDLATLLEGVWSTLRQIAAHAARQADDTSILVAQGATS